MNGFLMTKNNKHITRGSLLANNALITLLSQALPLVVAVICIPYLVSGMGIERFGVLTLVWMVTGYYSLFDFGVGRALTKMVASKLGAGEEKDISALVWTALFFVFLMGMLGTFIVYMISPYLVKEVFQITAKLHNETLNVLYLLSLSLPVVICATSLRGVLEAYQRFPFISIIRTPVGIMTFLGPLLVLNFSQSLTYIVLALLFIRLVECIAYLLFCFHINPSLRKGIVPEIRYLRPLLATGGWMTVSNIVGPTLLYLDRFLISTIISVSAVAFYTTPFEILHRLMIIPGAIVGVLFPAFSHSFKHDPKRITIIFSRGVKYTFIAMFPPILVITTFSYEGINLWLGSEFAQNSSSVLQLLAVGSLIGSMTYMPYALIQAGGRSDFTAKLHFFELPFYLIIMWWLTKNYGIDGAAFALILRFSTDALFLFFKAKKLLNINFLFRKLILYVTGIIMLLFVSTIIPSDLVLKSFFLLITIFIFILISWFNILNLNERRVLWKYFHAKLVLILKK